MLKRPKVVDMFCGAGGMSLGMEAAGCDVVVAVDIDPVHCVTHHYNFPDTKTICADVRLINGQDIVERFGQIDIVCGGPPCQGFSSIGKRKDDDPRNDLVMEFARIIGEIMPKHVVFENVPGILVGNKRKHLDEFVSGIKQLGYNVAEPIAKLNASCFGVAQDRERVIVLGSLSGTPSYPEILTNNSPTCWDAIGDLEDVTPELVPRIGTFLKVSRDIEGNCYRRRCVDNFTFNHVATIHNDSWADRISECPPGKTEKRSRLYRLHPDKPSRTLRAGTTPSRGSYTAPRPIHYMWPRCITVREAARLHGYPDWFRFHDTIWHGFRQIGNSVCPPLAREIGKALLGDLNVTSGNVVGFGHDYVLAFSAIDAAEHLDVSVKHEKRTRSCVTLSTSTKNRPYR